jgi:hypothetical protein
MTVGTSLSGMNADRVAVTVARKSLGSKPHKRTYPALGTVIINIQATQHDSLCALRIFARVDEVMEKLAQRLGLPALSPDNSDFVNYAPEIPEGLCVEEDVFLVRYNGKGERLADGAAPAQLDLREGAKVVVTAGPYKGARGEVNSKNREGHYRICLHVKTDAGKLVNCATIFGTWFVEAAVKGTLPTFPIVNARPE